MTVSELIAYLQRCQQEHGDDIRIELVVNGDRGRLSAAGVVRYQKPPVILLVAGS